jgi:hypothetical protein
MKSPTAEYKGLRRKLREAKCILQRVPDHSCSSNLHHLKVQSYVLLAHAAFEEYLENISNAIVQESVNRYNSSHTINECIVSLIVFETVAQFDKTTPRKAIKSEVVKKLNQFINLARVNHSNLVSSNNGIKGKDQKALFLPLGIDPEDVDPVTYAALDAFGVKRGGIAHKFKTQTSDTKSSMLQITETIFIGLESLDQEACLVLANHMVSKP